MKMDTQRTLDHAALPSLRGSVSGICWCLLNGVFGEKCDWLAI